MLAVAEGEQGRAVDAGDAFLAAGDRFADRMGRPEGGGNQVADVVGRALAVHHDFLADDFALEGDLAFREDRTPDEVGQHVGQQRQRVRVAAGLIGDDVLRGAGVERGAHVFGFQADRTGVAALGALEDHVLDEVRQTGLAGGIVAAAGGQVDRQRRALRLRQGGDREAEAAGQGEGLVAGAAHRISAVARWMSAGTVILGFGKGEVMSLVEMPIASTAETSSVTISWRSRTAA